MNKMIKIKVSGKGENPTKITLRSGKFSLVIDEPEEMGGTGDGPNPMQVLLFSLAGCFYVTANFVAKEMNLKLNNLKLELNGEINPCKFMGMNTTERAGFKNIKLNLIPEFEENYDDVTLKKWIESIENRCPVTDNIKNPSALEVDIKIIPNR